jgi:hypothetical protein
MRGVVFNGGREIEMMKFPDQTPGPGEVVVEMKASGMCGSDLHQYRRPKSGGEAIGGGSAGRRARCGGAGRHRKRKHEPICERADAIAHRHPYRSFPTAEPMVRRLTAGGKWIRTSGPSLH